MCYNERNNVADTSGLVNLLKQCKSLKWLGIDTDSRFELTQEEFESLPESLEVIYITGAVNKGSAKFVSEALDKLPKRIRLAFVNNNFEQSL